VEIKQAEDTFATEKIEMTAISGIERDALDKGGEKKGLGKPEHAHRSKR